MRVHNRRHNFVGMDATPQDVAVSQRQRREDAEKTTHESKGSKI